MNPTCPRQDKLPYRATRLRIYGDIAEITRVINPGHGSHDGCGEGVSGTCDKKTSAR